MPAELVPFSEAMIELGVGYQRSTGQVMPSPFEGPSEVEVETEETPTSSLEVEDALGVKTKLVLIESEAQLVEELRGGCLDGKVQLNPNGGLDFGAAAYVLLSVKVTRSLVRMRNRPKLIEEFVPDKANATDFFRKFGDCYVYALAIGGEIQGLIEVRAAQDEDVESITSVASEAVRGFTRSNLTLEAAVKAMAEGRRSFVNAATKGGGISMAPLDAESFARFVLDFPLMVRGVNGETRERLGYAEDQNTLEETELGPDKLTNVDAQELPGSSSVVRGGFQGKERLAVTEIADAPGAAAATVVASASAAPDQPVEPVKVGSEDLGEEVSAQNDVQRPDPVAAKSDGTQTKVRVVPVGIEAPRFRLFEQTLSFPGISVPIEALCREFRSLRAFAGVEYDEKELAPGVADDMKLRFRDLQRMYNWISGIIAKHSPNKLTVEELMELEYLRKDLRDRRLLVLNALEDRHKVLREEFGDQNYVETTTSRVQSIVNRVES